jgi:hypothetical protein
MQRRARIYFELKEESLDIKVKRKIISAGGIVGQDPATLFNKLRLADDLLYDERKFQQLCNLLQKLVAVEKPSAKLKCSDVSDCDTVGDEVELIDKTVNGK